MTWAGPGAPAVITAVLLAAYAVAAGFLAPSVLRRGWTARSPRLAMSLWLALALSAVIASVLAILAVTMPAWLTWGGSGQVASHGGAAGWILPCAGLVLTAAIVLRVGTCLVSESVRGRRERGEHAALVAAAGRPDYELGVVVLDHDTPTAYCLPHGQQRIVVSAGALAALRTEQMQAVVAHERAHLRGFHHLMLATGAALARAFPRVPLLAQARPQLAVLAEMAADDAAARSHDRGDLAEALIILARAGARSTALAAGGPAVIARVQRLLTPPARRPARRTRLAAAAGLILPVIIASLPLLMAACDAVSRP
ncbi:MAG: M56 family metallopeptidase [Streptosporangiaceae bacterium]